MTASPGRCWTSAPYASISCREPDTHLRDERHFLRGSSDHNLASAPIDDPTIWTYDASYPSIGPANIQSMQYNMDHHILYVSSCFGGMWRLRTE